MNPATPLSTSRSFGSGATQTTSQPPMSTENTTPPPDTATPEIDASAQEAHRTIKHTAFAWISKTAMDRLFSKSTPTTLAVYMALARLESDAPVNHKASIFATPENIGKLAGVSDRCVREHLKILQEKGLIKIHSGRGKKYKGGFSANSYTLLEAENRSGRLSAHNVPSSLSAHNVPTNKETLSEGKRVSLKKRGSACAPPAGAGSAASLLKKELKEQQAATYRLQLAMNPPTPKAHPGSCIGGF